MYEHCLQPNDPDCAEKQEMRIIAQDNMPAKPDPDIARAEDRTKNDKDFLMWIRNRMVNLFGDDPESEYIKRLEDMSIFLPGPTVIPLRNSAVNPEYVRVARFQLSDLGDFFLFHKDAAEPMRKDTE